MVPWNDCGDVLLSIKIGFCIYVLAKPQLQLGDGLTHWGRKKIDAILQTTFSNAFSWMKMFEFRLQFHWSLFLKVQLTIFGAKPLSDPVMAQFNDAYMRHSASMS